MQYFYKSFVYKAYRKLCKTYVFRPLSFTFGQLIFPLKTRIFKSIAYPKIVRMRLLRLYLSLFITVLSFSTFAQFRKYSNEFLNIGAGARGLAMGSAQVASVNDGTGGYWNPAALVGVKDHPNLNLMHAEYFAGIGKYDYASIALPMANNKRA